MAINERVARRGERDAQSSPQWGGALASWLGIVPFMAFALLFLIFPTLSLILGAFRNADGQFTLVNIAHLFDSAIRDAYWVSFKISAVSAAGGAIIGLMLALAVIRGALPDWIRPTVMRRCAKSRWTSRKALTS